MPSVSATMAPLTPAVDQSIALRATSGLTSKCFLDGFLCLTGTDEDGGCGDGVVLAGEPADVSAGTEDALTCPCGVVVVATAWWWCSVVRASFSVVNCMWCIGIWLTADNTWKSNSNTHWLHRGVNNPGTHWNGVPVEIFAAVTPLRLEVYISGPPKFLTLVKAQNRGLRTER